MRMYIKLTHFTEDNMLKVFKDDDDIIISEQGTGLYLSLSISEAQDLVLWIIEAINGQPRK